MKSGLRPEGFTLVESLIVLAVTGFLFTVAALYINGRQAKTEFQSGTRELQTRLQQVVNEVANGYYQNPGNFRCTSFAGAPQISNGSTTQGGNIDCMFLGKIVQFNADNKNPEHFNVYSVVGLREARPGQLTTTLTEANPRIIPLNTGAYDSVPMPYGMTTVPSKTDVGAIGFVSNLNSLDIEGPSQQIDVYPLSGVSPGATTGSAIATIETDRTRSLKATTPNPSGGIHWCVASGGTNQSALYTIGGQGRQLTISVDIKNGTAC